MNSTLLPDHQGFPVTGRVTATFAGTAHFFSVSGPGTLVRLIQFGKTTYDGLSVEDSRRGGSFWFDERLLLRVRSEARKELARQQAEAKQPFAAPLSSLITLYLRHYFRGALAVSKDWTNDFDAYVCLRLKPKDHLVALIGPAARQPAYSDQHSQHQWNVEVLASIRALFALPAARHAGGGRLP